MSIEEKAKRYDAIRDAVYRILQRMPQDYFAADPDALLVLRCVQPHVTREQAREQRERLKRECDAMRKTN
jgi:hypothetical protein